VQHKVETMKRTTFFLVVTILLISCKNEKVENNLQLNNYYPLTKNRVAAEWEPARGVLFACPPVIPKELIIELAKDTHIYPIVDGEVGQREAEKWFKKWGIDSTNVSFIKLKVDSDIYYPRDWGPSGVFLNDGDFKVADAKFINSDPFTDMACNDSLELHKSDKDGQIYYSTNADNAIMPLANQLGLKVINIPFTSTGGNVLTDGIGSAFSTCIILTENRFNGLSDAEFFTLNDSLLGYTNYHVISNFEEYGIQHIDCLLKLVDEETILVAAPPEDHELYNVYENIVKNELLKLRTAYGRAYKIKRIKTARFFEDYLTAYTNSLILNKIVYVPLYGIKEDSLALKTWESVMPGYTIKGFNYNLDISPFKSNSLFDEYVEYGVNVGWAYDDALHCRTRAIWDPEMIFISLKKISPTVPTNQDAILYSTIKDYSAELEGNSVALYWRVKGSGTWNTKIMSKDGSLNHWFAKIPNHKENTVIEYYVEVHSKSGKIEKRPITAPEGYYNFKYVAQQRIKNII